MKYLILIVSLFCTSSCKNNTCDITDYRNGNWEIVDSAISYKLCSSDKKILSPTDSIQIEYLGILKEVQNILIQNSTDQLILTLLTDIPLGRYQQNQIISILSLSKILPSLTKNSECLVRIKLKNVQIPLFGEILTAYFKQEADTLEIFKLNEKIAKFNFVDSVKYVSSDEALKKYSDENDTAWKAILTNNPLPASTNIYIKKGFYSPSLKDSLSNLFSAERIVSQIIYPKANSSELFDLSEFLKFPFFVKIKS